RVEDGALPGRGRVLVSGPPPRDVRVRLPAGGDRQRRGLGFRRRFRGGRRDRLGRERRLGGRGFLDRGGRDGGRVGRRDRRRRRLGCRARRGVHVEVGGGGVAGLAEACDRGEVALWRPGDRDGTALGEGTEDLAVGGRLDAAAQPLATGVHDRADQRLR